MSVFGKIHSPALTEFYCCPQTRDQIVPFLTHRDRWASQVDPKVSEYSGVPQTGFPYISLDHTTPLSHSTILGLLQRLEYFLVDQIECGNLPVQFLETKVAFVTQITGFCFVFYQLRWEPCRSPKEAGAGLCCTVVRRWAARRCPTGGGVFISTTPFYEPHCVCLLGKATEEAHHAGPLWDRETWLLSLSSVLMVTLFVAAWHGAKLGIMGGTVKRLWSQILCVGLLIAILVELAKPLCAPTLFIMP